MAFVTDAYNLSRESKPIRVTLETADGRVVTGQAIAAEFSMETEAYPMYVFGDTMPFTYPGRTHWHIRLEGIGEAKMSLGTDYRQGVYRARSANEWQCDYCHTIWPRAKNKCASCGASRSFIYE